MTVPSLFMLTDGRATPEIRPGLEFVLRGFGCIRHTPIKVGVEVWDDIPVRAFEMIAGRELVGLHLGGLDKTLIAPGSEPLVLFELVKLYFEEEPDIMGIEWRLGDEPVARVTREEMGL